MAKLVSKGLPVKMIANYVQTSPMSIISFADKGIKGPKDLEGKKVSFTAGDSLHQGFPALIKLNNVDKAKVQEVLLAPAAKQTAVMTGTVDAMGGYYTTQAGAIERETGKKVAYFRYADHGVNAMTQGLLIHTKFLGERALNCKMVKATTRAWQAAMTRSRRRRRGAPQALPQHEQGRQGPHQEAMGRLRRPPVLEGLAGQDAGPDDERGLGRADRLAKDYGGLDPVKPAAEYYTNEFFDCK